MADHIKNKTLEKVRKAKIGRGSYVGRPVVVKPQTLAVDTYMRWLAAYRRSR